MMTLSVFTLLTENVTTRKTVAQSMRVETAEVTDATQLPSFLLYYVSHHFKSSFTFKITTNGGVYIYINTLSNKLTS